MKEILALILSAALTLTGCSGAVISPAASDEPDGGGTPALTGYTLAQPDYPEFPAYPQEPEDGDWDAYFEEYNAYYEALRTLRGDGINEDTTAALTAFAGRSTISALAGHEGENAVYSPLSLWAALAMLAQCADGTSRQQVLDALGADSVEALREQVSQVWRGLYTDDGNSSLLLANSIWLNSGMDGAYVQDTLDVLAEQYYAGAYAVPMGTGSADQAVTEWISRQTNGLIGSSGPVVQTKAETLALLVSSLYYRAGWTDEFSSGLTVQDVFTGAGGTEILTDFMHKTERGAFLDRPGYQAAQLPTRLGQMVFVLPDEGVTPEELLQDPDFLISLDFSGDDAHYGEVQWSVPKFDVDSSLDLLDTLAALGISDLLDKGRADLSSLTTLDAYLSGAEQLARVKVDEEGVEAAAVTILMTEATSAMPDEDPEICVMDLDRPFLFVIYTAGIPLFIGTVNQLQA